MRRPPTTASEVALGRLGAWLADLDALRYRRFDQDDLADRGLVRSLILDVRAGLDDLETKLALQPVELEDDRRARAYRRA